MAKYQYSDEMMKDYVEACDKAKSNLEAPLLGCILTPLCASCVNIDMKYGTFDKPVCDIYGENPLYMDCHHFDCPHYKQKPNIDDSHLPEHMRKNNK